MSKLTLNLPESFRRQPAMLAGLEGMSFEHFVALAVAEKLSAMESVELLRREVAGARREDFEKYLGPFRMCRPTRVTVSSEIPTCTLSQAPRAFRARAEAAMSPFFVPRPSGSSNVPLLRSSVIHRAKSANRGSRASL